MDQKSLARALRRVGLVGDSRLSYLRETVPYFISYLVHAESQRVPLLMSCFRNDQLDHDSPFLRPQVDDFVKLQSCCKSIMHQQT